MANCPICQTKLTENAKYCAECGARLEGAVNERAWIIAMQERIKSVRHNDIVYSIVSTIGLLIAVAVPFLMRFVLLYTMDKVSWTITAVGAALFVGGMVANWVDDRNVKKLITILEKGEPPTEEPETGDENQTHAE
jgi:hypothetical protein